MSELLLLYVIRIADMELTALDEALSRPPNCQLQGAKEVSVRVHAAREESKHFWFLGGAPTDWDRAVAANDRMFDRDGPEGVLRGERINPQSLSIEDIGYARNPLDRIVRLHEGFNELTTGVTYRSPWPRDDARMR